MHCIDNLNHSLANLLQSQGYLSRYIAEHNAHANLGKLWPSQEQSEYR